MFPFGQKGQKIKGTMVVMQKNVLDINSITSVGGIVDQGLGFIGSAVDALTFAATKISIQLISATKADGGKGKIGKSTNLRGKITLPTLGAGEQAYDVNFEWDSDFGIPGAFYIKNFMQNEFYLKSLILEDIPNHGTIHFVCNSWVYNSKNYKTDRIFFANNTYLPSETPAPLLKYREEELKNVRGDGTGERKEWDRIYDYDVYNDLGNPDSGDKYARPVLGGSALPYPRRGRTGRGKTRKVDKSAWMTDEEFARETIAGLNPNVIKIIEEFPLSSKLDTQAYGDHTCIIAKEHLEPNLGGLTVEQAIQNKKLFILDHHDYLIPYLRKINANTTKTYATRTIFFLKDDGTLTPLAIELSKPHPQGEEYGPVSEVYVPASEGVEAYIWLLAKAYVVVNDACYHQIISHWLSTHAIVEPFVIATNRQLSVVHPIYKLLFPHYRDTMNINSLARKALVNADGIIEKTFLWGRYSMEMSAVIYKDWVFTDQALPNDLVKRGVAVKDPSAPHGVRLLIEDYPYASDGLEIWDAIKSWVQEYVSFYYKSDEELQKDPELQAWWKELVEVGHGDLKDKPWWQKMQTREELVEASAILIWIASALHAAVNFGQYPYGGLILNRPTISRRFMPEKGSPEYDALAKNPEKEFLKTITGKKETLIDLTVIEILSRHASDEFYLGQRDGGDYWTSDAGPLEAFKRFGKKLEEIEKKLIEKNKDETLRNRYGPAKMPYTLLYPSSEEGLTLRGIPNSISI
ncbi:Linoleate 9S-lipoxygenase-4 [Glycine soja]|nr:Linoleate 9S-lipoxygenase-4 [Glycine soja]